MIENEVKKTEKGFLKEFRGRKIYLNDFICLHTTDHTKLHYSCDLTVIPAPFRDASGLKTFSVWWLQFKKKKILIKDILIDNIKTKKHVLKY